MTVKLDHESPESYEARRAYDRARVSVTALRLQLERAELEAVEAVEALRALQNGKPLPNRALVGRGEIRAVVDQLRAKAQNAMEAKAYACRSDNEIDRTFYLGRQTAHTEAADLLETLIEENPEKIT